MLENFTAQYKSDNFTASHHLQLYLGSLDDVYTVHEDSSTPGKKGLDWGSIKHPFSAGASKFSLIKRNLTNMVAKFTLISHALFPNKRKEFLR